MAIRFGTLGAANITPRALLAPCHDEPRAAVRCVAARERERAEGCARWHGTPVGQMRTIDRCYEAAGLPIRGLDLS